MPVMSHPGLPPEQTVTVADEAVPHMERAGWITETSADTGGESPAEPDTTDQAAGSDSEQEN